MYKNSSAPSNNTALWHNLGTKHVDFRHGNTGVIFKTKILNLKRSRD